MDKKSKRRIKRGVNFNDEMGKGSMDGQKLLLKDITFQTLLKN